MEIRFAVHQSQAKTFDTQQLREHFLIENLMQPDKLNFTYTHYDRVMVGGAMPVKSILKLETYDALKSDYFLERREIGIINVGGDGVIVTDGKAHDLRKLDCLYVGKGVMEVTFASKDAAHPAVFYLLSSPAHAFHATALMLRENASPLELGAEETANKRTVYKYIHLDGLRSCQLVMGLTVLKSGSVWNTIPTHVHDRRMEAYFYFDVNENHRVFHFMGEPTETRHILVANYDAIVSPAWSIHSGAGTSNYGFIWGMAGENLVYSDMDVWQVKDIR